MLGFIFTFLDDYYDHIMSLKTDHPSLKVLLMVGGPSTAATDQSLAFSTVANTTENMQLFASNVAVYLEHFGFDGVELDWRYPGRYGSEAKDVQGYSALISVRLCNNYYILIIDGIFATCKAFYHRCYNATD